MLLIFPPVAKPCEPPAGIAKLAGALEAHGIPCSLWDANLEGLLYLSKKPVSASDTWTRRAIKNLPKNLAGLRDPRTYRSFDRYSRAVHDVSRVLGTAAMEYGAIIGLADYHHRLLSPVRSADLIFAAEHPEKNPFYDYFKKRLPEVLGKTFLPQRREGREENLEKKYSNEEQAGSIIGFSLNYLSQALTTFAMIGFVKKEFPAMKIILGGGLATSWMKRPGWKNPFGGLVDHLIAGPGEGPFLELLGIKSGKSACCTPEYDHLPRRDYLSPGFILPYSASSGCYWNKCSFCPETAEGNPYVPIPAERAMSDITALVERTEPVLVHFLDSAISPALMRELAENPIGAPWYGFARISRELAAPDFCARLKRSGCVMLKLGLESGDQKVLDRLNKGIDLETASRALGSLKKAGIAAHVYLLFGTPEETVVEARRTLEFVAAHHETISFLNLAVFNMPLCGKETGKYETEQFYEGDLSLYTGFRHPRGWDRKRVRQFLNDEFRKHRAVADIMNNDPPAFTSNHAAFFARP